MCPQYKWTLQRHSLLWFSYWCSLKCWVTFLLSSGPGILKNFLDDSACRIPTRFLQEEIIVLLLLILTTTGLPLFAVESHYWTVPPYVAQWCPDPVRSSIDGRSPLCVADSSWVSEVSWVVSWIASSFFRPSFSFPKIFKILIIFYSTCALLAVLLSAGIFMWEWGICWPGSLTQTLEWEWVPSALFAVRDLYV